VTGLRYPSPSLEAQVADLADEIAYSSHDLDDGLDAELLETTTLEAVPLWMRAFDRARREYPRTRPDRHRGFIIRCLVNHLVEDLVAQTSAHLARSRVASCADIRNHPARLAAFSPKIRGELTTLRRFLFKNLYRHPEVATANRQAARMISELFHALAAKPSLLGRKAKSRIRRDGLKRSLCDYISGMTDCYLAQQHRELVRGSG
jgi:dGTPase